MILEYYITCDVNGGLCFTLVGVGGSDSVKIF